MDLQRHQTRDYGEMGTLRRSDNAAERRLNLARWLYWTREIRPPFGDQLYGEPAWDMLLDLYLRQKMGSRSSVTSACIGSRAPHTTALRHVAALCEAGWFERVVDEADRRRNWLSLTPDAEARLERYLDRLLATLEQGIGP